MLIPIAGSLERIFLERIVEKHRGKDAADQLRDDCRKEWAKRREVV